MLFIFCFNFIWILRIVNKIWIKNKIDLVNINKNTQGGEIMKTLTKMFLLCCWCMFSIGFAKDHLDQIQENAQLQTIQEKLELEQALEDLES